MKAIRVHQFGGPEQLKLENVPDPEPEPEQAVVKVHAAGVNPFETYMRTGTYAIKPQLPYTPGADGAGVVLKVGAGVAKFKAGDRVYIAGSVSGTYAEQALCTHSQLHPLPAKVSFEQGAAMGVPYATAYRALFQKANALPGEIVLVHGASGGVGLAAVQLARAHGMTVIGTAGTSEGRELVKQNGAHHVLDHSQPDVADSIKQLSEGRGVDVILEMLANKNLARDLTMLAVRGRVIVIGNRGTIEINPRDAMGRDAAILGFTLFNTPEKDLAAIHAALVAALENGVARPVIGKKIPLGEAARAHEEILQAGSYGKIVLIP
ncbi:MAG: NADPH:quinone reductase [Acidobacteria bacterium]|nr:NADPH:quinone reductase [Acidobacteriota bacterium]MBV9437835.1 NADPH:quinone reductase [Acidobacteriota bacterium]